MTHPGFAVVRFNTDETLDSAFDTDGTATYNVGGVDKIEDIALQQDGKILVGGSKDNDFVIARIDESNGALDTSYGTSSGYTVTDIGSATADDGYHRLSIRLDGQTVPTSTKAMASVTAAVTGGHYGQPVRVGDDQLPAIGKGYLPPERFRDRFNDVGMVKSGAIYVHPDPKRDPIPGKVAGANARAGGATLAAKGVKGIGDLVDEALYGLDTVTVETWVPKRQGDPAFYQVMGVSYSLGERIIDTWVPK